MVRDPSGTAVERPRPHGAPWSLEPAAPAVVPTYGQVAQTLLGGDQASNIAIYESIMALHVAAADAGLSCSGDLAAEAERAATALIGDARHELSPELRSAVSVFDSWTSVPKVPASIGVQGVEFVDAIRLADEWAVNYHNADADVLVAGLRTGGAYLAAVVSSRLRASGVDARFLSVRPGQDLPQFQAESHVLLIDDPPLTGSAIRAALKAIGPGVKTYVLVPVFDQQSREAMGKRAGVPVISLDRTVWASALRLEHQAISRVLSEEVEWRTDNEPVTVRSYVPGYGNSAVSPWPTGRRRAAPRAAFEAELRDGTNRRIVARWVPPGIFGGPARLAATQSTQSARPTVLGIGRSVILTEFIDPESVQGVPDLSSRLTYVQRRARSTRSPGPCFPDEPDPTLRVVADSLHGHGLKVAYDDIVDRLRCVFASLPDNRCQQDKWAVADDRLIKFGGLDHALRRDNQLMSSLIDLAALACSEPHEPLERFAEGLDLVDHDVDPRRRTEALQIAVLYYAVGRGIQLPRMYTAAHATTLAIEAIKTQHRVDEVLRAVGVPRSGRMRDSGDDVGIRIDLTPSTTTVSGTLHPRPTSTTSFAHRHLVPAAVGVIEDSAGRLFFYRRTDSTPEFADWLLILRRSEELDWLGVPTLHGGTT